MAYDHSGDLPESYPVDLVAWELSLEGEFEAAAQSASQNNKLNLLALTAIARTLPRFAGKYAGDIMIGAKLYAAVTDPSRLGDEQAPLTYFEPEQEKVAEQTIASLEQTKSASDFEIRIMSQFWEMVRTTRQLNRLIDRVAFEAGFDQQKTDRIRMGAALLRALHIEASRRLNSP